MSPKGILAPQGCPTGIGLRMITKPDRSSSATRRSATTFDMVSAACDREKAPPLGSASERQISMSCREAGVSLSFMVLGGYIGGRTFQERNKPRHDRPFANV